MGIMLQHRLNSTSRQEAKIDNWLYLEGRLRITRVESPLRLLRESNEILLLGELVTIVIGAAHRNIFVVKAV